MKPGDLVRLKANDVSDENSFYLDPLTQEGLFLSSDSLGTILDISTPYPHPYDVIRVLFPTGTFNFYPQSLQVIQ